MKDHLSATHPSPVVQEYARLAPKYDAKWARYVQATTSATMERLPAFQGALLDVGCGTGTLLVQLAAADRFDRLAGADPSGEMLGVARRRLPSTVELHEAWAESLPFDDARFDTVVSSSVFHYIRHPQEALREMFRVLRPGGSLVITDWCDDFLACRICDWYLRRFDPSHFRMYGTGELRELLAASGACNIRLDRYRISWLWGLMTATCNRPHTPGSAFRPPPGSGPQVKGE